jgi:prevent-host-death family protein
MSETQVNIGKTTRNISELINRVAFGGERIIFTSRGKPKAVLVSLEDYQQLQHVESIKQETQWQNWQKRTAELSARILARRGGEPLDLDATWLAEKADQEARDDAISGY